MTDAATIAKGLTKAQRRAVMAMGAGWMTTAEMRPAATQASGDVLYQMHRRNPLCERQWATWGSERGQKRGEGYEYRLTPLGLAVRAHLQEQTP